MPLNWPGASMVGGDLDETERNPIIEMLNDFCDRAANSLAEVGLAPYASPLWRPWNLIVARDVEKVVAAFTTLSGGMANVQWLDHKTQLFSPEELERAVRDELGQQVAALVTLPLPEAHDRPVVLAAAARQHVEQVERASRLGRLGDLTVLLTWSRT